MSSHSPLNRQRLSTGGSSSTSQLSCYSPLNRQSVSTNSPSPLQVSCYSPLNRQHLSTEGSSSISQVSCHSPLNRQSFSTNNPSLLQVNYLPPQEPDRRFVSTPSSSASEAFYKEGDKVMVISKTVERWCPGTVNHVKGNRDIEVKFETPDGETKLKDLTYPYNPKCVTRC